MQSDPGFEVKLVAVCTTLENTVLLGFWISIEEQQKLFVQKPEHKPENTILTLSLSMHARHHNKRGKGMSMLHPEY